MIIKSRKFSYNNPNLFQVNQVRKQNRVKIKNQDNLNELEVQSISSQMSQHFLYNSLNSIEHFIIKNKTKEAVSCLDRFSRLVRLTLRNSRSRTIPLSDEIEALTLYLELESVRFKDKFNYSITIDKDIYTYDIDIRSMIIQPFVESAIANGLKNKKEKGFISIYISQIENQLICKIEDNGIGEVATMNLRQNSNPKQKPMGSSITHHKMDMIKESLDANTQIEVTDLVNDQGLLTGRQVVLSFPIQ